MTTPTNFCKDCKWMVNTSRFANASNFMICTNDVVSVDPVTGNNVAPKCSDMRLGPCGYAGQYWEAKP